MSLTREFLCFGAVSCSLALKNEALIVAELGLLNYQRQSCPSFLRVVSIDVSFVSTGQQLTFD